MRTHRDEAGRCALGGRGCKPASGRGWKGRWRSGRALVQEQIPACREQGKREKGENRFAREGARGRGWRIGGGDQGAAVLAPGVELGDQGIDRTLAAMRVAVDR